jgi:hypothetical protein
MVNFLSPLRPLRRLMALGLLMAVVAPLAMPTAEGAEKHYKKSTVVDFEGALVEGKSRKPYSAYLTQQKDSAFNDLHSWEPDLDRSLFEAQRKMDSAL